MYRFAHIEYLHLLWLIPALVVLFVLYQNWQKRARLRWGDATLLTKMTEGKSNFKPWLKLIYSCFAIAFLAIGLANPQVGTKMETVKRQGVDLVFALDVSASMLAEDVAPNRLEKSKQLVSQIINKLGSDRIGIIAYSGSAFPVLPITTDYSVAKIFLQTMNPGMVSAQGTSIDEAINLATTFVDKKIMVENIGHLKFLLTNQGFEKGNERLCYKTLDTSLIYCS